MISQTLRILLPPLYTDAYLPEFHELPDMAKTAAACSIIGPISGKGAEWRSRSALVS